MRVSVIVIVLSAVTAVIASVFYGLGRRAPLATAAASMQVSESITFERPLQAAQLVKMQQQITLLEARLQVLESRSVTTAGVSVAQNHGVPRLAPSNDKQRPVEDTEQRRALMAELAQSFHEERVDPSWSARAKSRILATFNADPALQGLTHSVDCRRHTCRVEIHEGDTNGLTDSLPLLALGLGDILPRMFTERVSLGAGNALVVYLSAAN